MKKNKIVTREEAIKVIKHGDRIMVGGFGQKGSPKYLIDALGETDAKELTIISNDLGSPGEGLGVLLRTNSIKALIGNYYNWNTEVADAFNAGQIDVTLLPQGNFAEAIRAGGVGIPAFYTKIGVGTELAEGKEIRTFGDEEYMLLESLVADVAIIQADKADELGNLVYERVARNFNPSMATAAKTTIVEVSEIVPVGELDPECIVTQHIYVDYLVVREDKEDNHEGA